MITSHDIILHKNNVMPGIDHVTSVTMATISLRAPPLVWVEGGAALIAWFGGSDSGNGGPLLCGWKEEQL